MNMFVSFFHLVGNRSLRYDKILLCGGSDRKYIAYADRFRTIGRTRYVCLLELSTPALATDMMGPLSRSTTASGRSSSYCGQSPTGCCGSRLHAIMQHRRPGVAVPQ